MMKNALVVGCVLMAMVAGATVRDFSSVRIDVPPNALGRVREASEELRNDLKLVCGSEVCADAPIRFVFGAPADARPLKPFESRYRIDGATIYLWGDDSDDKKVPRDGSFFAVSLFLERELGMRWLWEGRDGIAYTARRQVDLPDRREGTYETTLVKNEIRNYANFSTNDVSWREFNGLTPPELRDMSKEYLRRSHAERKLWLRRMRLQHRASLNYGHAFIDWKQRFGKTHPEYLNWNAAKKARGITGGNEPRGVKLCVSNEAVVDQILSDWQRRGLPEYLCVCENDHLNFCECDACRALDADLPGEKPLSHMTDRYCNFWNRLAKKAVRMRPDVKLIAYAYSVYRNPPRRERIEYPDNMLLGFVPSIMDDVSASLDAWIARGMKHFFLRPNFHHYGASIPRGYERIFYDTFQTCLKRGMIGVDYDAPAHRDLMNFEYYVTARVMNDPKITFEAICAEYYGGFEAAAEDVRRYLECVRRDGEAARQAFIRRRLDGVSVLDDSEFGHLITYGYEESKLRQNAALITRICRRWKGKVSPVCARRLENLRLLAEHGVLAYRHAVASFRNDKAAFSRCGRELVDFRLANREAIRDCWPQRFGAWGSEVRLWKKDPQYRIVSNDRGFLDPRGVKYGWSLNFESMSYNRWRKSDGVSEITNDRASLGSWSCRLDATRRSSIRDDNWMVIPGRTYRLTADLCAVGTKSGATIKVSAYGVPEKKIPGRTLVCREIGADELPEGTWKTFSVTFTAPTEFPKERARWGADFVQCVMPWVIAGAKGGTGSVYVDNIRMTLVEAKVASPEITWSVMHPTAIDTNYMARVAEQAVRYGGVGSFEVCGDCHRGYSGINGLSMLTRYPHAAEHVDRAAVERNRREMNAICAIAHRIGKPLYYWHREIFIPEGLLEDLPALLDEDGEFDLLGTAYQDWLRYKLDETFTHCPGLDGIVLTLTEADYSVIHNSNPKRYPPQRVVAELVGLFAEEHEKRGKRFILRSFGSNAQDYTDIIGGAKRAAAKHAFEIETKVTEADFVPWLPTNPFLKRNPPLTLGAECDALGEYLSAGYLPAAHVARIKAYVDSARAAGTDRYTIRLDRFGKTIFDTAHEVNLYAYMRFISDPTATVDGVFADYGAKRFGAAADEMIPLLKDGLELIRNIHYVASNLVFHAFPLRTDLKTVKAGGIFSVYRENRSLEGTKDIWSVLSWMKTPTHAQILAEKAKGVAMADAALRKVEALAGKMPAEEYARQHRAFAAATKVARALEAFAKCCVAYFEDMAARRDDPVRLRQACEQARALLESLAAQPSADADLDRAYFAGLRHYFRELPNEYACERNLRREYEVRKGVLDFVTVGGIYDDNRTIRTMHGAYALTLDGRVVRQAGNPVFPNGTISVRFRDVPGAKVEVALDPTGAQDYTLRESLSDGFRTVTIGKKGRDYPRVRVLALVASVAFPQPVGDAFEPLAPIAVKDGLARSGLPRIDE